MKRFFALECLIGFVTSLLLLSACSAYNTSPSAASESSGSIEVKDTIQSQASENTSEDTSQITTPMTPTDSVTIVALSSDTFKGACDQLGITVNDLSDSYPAELIHLLAYNDVYFFTYSQFSDEKAAQAEFEVEYTAEENGEEGAGLEGTLSREDIPNGELFIFTGNDRYTAYTVCVRSGDRLLSGSVWSLDKDQISELNKFFSGFGFKVDGSN